MRTTWLTAVSIVLAVIAPAVNASAQFTPLHDFSANAPGDPLYPNGLVQGSDGNFYGTTQASVGPPTTCGSIIKMTPAGALSVLYSFKDTTDGCASAASLIQARDGNFYGTTTSGGFSAPNGSVFSITPAGVFHSLHAFNISDGAQPGAATLLEGRDGNLYGTTQLGGQFNDGTVYRISPAGALDVLHSFAGGATDGAFPRGGLIQAFDGNFYGTTVGGGSSLIGTVFKMTPSGAVTVLHTFTGPPLDGNGPYAGLVQTPDGNFYGTTYTGGAFDLGMVFKITPAGSLTIMHSFKGDTDGVQPAAPLILSSDLTLYGTTQFGPVSGVISGAGTIFSMTLGGSLSTVHVFEGLDGRNTQSPLVHAMDDNFYGTALAGGPGGFGTAFRLANPASCDDSLRLSFAAGTLNASFTLRTTSPATWATWLITSGGAVNLWSLSIPAITPAISFTVPLAPFPSLGEVFVVTVLSAPGGAVCLDFQGVNTGP